MSAHRPASATEKAPKVKIPGSYRRPMTERRFRRLQSMLTDKAERDSMEKYFPVGDDGKRRYQVPKDKRTAKKNDTILSKVHKARRGPRTIRLILLAILIGVPVIFNAFFLDTVASRQMEKFLEANLETDVAVTGLDIRLLEGRMELAELTVASRRNPMLDAVVLEGMALDFDLGALAGRRVIIETLDGELGLNRPRRTEAVYPGENDNQAAAEASDSREAGPDAPLDWMPVPELPDSSAELARRLREEAEGEAIRWQEDLEADRTRIEELLARTEAFVSEPLPDRTDIVGWKARIDDGRAIADELEAAGALVAGYAGRAERAATDARNASERVNAAISEDLAALEENFVPDAEMLSRWLEAAIGRYAGHRAASLYSRVIDLRRRFGGVGTDDRSGTDIPGTRGRMRSGRIVPFPVGRPPRFTIRRLDLRSGDSRLTGSDVGVDHHLAGAPSVMELVLDGVPGVPGHLDSEITIDGRDTAVDLVSGTIDATGFPWRVSSGDSGASGNMDANVDFRVPPADTSRLEADGTVRLEDWNDGVGSLSFIGPGAPPLDFSFDGAYDSGIRNLRVAIDNRSVSPWGRVLASSLGSVGLDEARGRLEEAAAPNLDGLDAVLDGWTGADGEIGTLDGAVSAAEDELDAMLADMLSQAGLDLPGVSDDAGGILGGLNNLF